jgi:hypothetical protein
MNDYLSDTLRERLWLELGDISYDDLYLRNHERTHKPR